MKKVVVVGAGIGGLASALQLAHQGYEVEVYEKNSTPGGKMRTVNSTSGPIDAGPTVFTLKHIFDALFQTVNEEIEDHLIFKQESVLARHFWPDGTVLDLSFSPEQNFNAIKAFAGIKAAIEFEKFDRLAKELYTSFNQPILHNPNPSIRESIKGSLKSALKIIPAIIPGRTLADLVKSSFTDKRLRQVFSRYATYIGGSPYNSPAILSLIWHAESLGVWKIEGGMHKLATKIADLAEHRGAHFHYNKSVSEILVTNQQVNGVRLDNGEEINCNYIVFNGDPLAIFTGLLGKNLNNLLPKKSVQERSLSAYVWTFAAKPSLHDLAHHNVFFNSIYRSEFDDIALGRMPRDPTLYVCAQDQEKQIKSNSANKFEIIMNAPPLSNNNFNEEEEFEICHQRTFKNLEKMGLTFTPSPSRTALTTPKIFSQLFPASSGSLYGLNPRKLMTTFLRPQAQTKIQGLYLAGGGVHPGPGIPMALLSGRHAAAAIIKDQTSI